MQYFLLLSVVLGAFLQNVFQKQYNLKTQGMNNASYVYNFMMAATSCILMIIVALFGFTFHLETLYYSLVFSVSYSLAVIFLFLAIHYGPLSLSSLFISFSLIIPTFYGLIFQQEQLSVFGIIGLICVFISIIMINSYKKGDKLSLKWFVFVILGFLGNGICSTVQKVHQINFPGMYQVEFMVFAMIVVTLIMGILLIFNRPTEFKPILKKGGVYASLTGGLNGMVNLLMLVLAAMLPATVLYPIVSGGGIALTFIVALTFYREKLSVVQYIGYFAGVASVILLSF